MIVGRRALLFNKVDSPLDLKEYKGDLDFWVSAQYIKEWLFKLKTPLKLDVVVMPEQILNSFSEESKNNGYASLEDLLAIKLSHFQYDIFWKKHKQDILYLSKMTDGRYNRPLYTLLVQHWNKEFSVEKSKLSLYKTKDEFFDDFVPKQHEHDYLHMLVAKEGVPIYTKCLKDGQEVFIDRSKFLFLSFEDKARMFQEEVAVIALERWILPSKKKGSMIPISFAWNWSLHKTVTALTKNWASEFMALNIKQFLKPLHSEIEYAIQMLNEENKMSDNVENSLDKLDSLVGYSLYKALEELYEELGGEYFEDLIRGYDGENIFEHIENDGGGKGGSEDCYSVIKYKGEFFKITFNYYSHQGYYFDNAEAFRVKPVEKLVTVYE